MMNHVSRRDLLKTGALAAAALPFAELFGLEASATAQTAAADPWRGLKIGVATYTFREWPLEETIKGLQRAGMKYISIKNVKNHIDLSHTPEERQSARKDVSATQAWFRWSVGNVGMKNDEAKCAAP
ncbi:MAG: twin-arginine translocation signal domain-containing protein [Acidobacteriota bacterium]